MLRLTVLRSRFLHSPIPPRCNHDAENQVKVELSRGQIPSRVNRLAIAPDFEMQSRLPFRPLPHRRNLLALANGVPLLDQQLGVVPVGTEVGVVMFKNNKLTVADQSTAHINNPAGGRGNNSL